MRARVRSWSAAVPAMAVLVTAVLTLAACTSSSTPVQPAPTIVSTHTVVQTRTSSAVPLPSVAPASTVAPLPPGRKPPRAERERYCPYLRTGLDQQRNTGTNLADIVGSRVYRTTVLTDHDPVGCRFYFYAPSYQAIADIVPTTFASAQSAHNALVRTAAAGTELEVHHEFVPGVDGILYRTKFFGDDGSRDWAFAFAKGRVLVVLHTDQDLQSTSAYLLGKAVVGKF